MRFAPLAVSALAAFSSSFALGAPTIQLVRPDGAPGAFAAPAFVNNRGDVSFHFAFAPNAWPQTSYIRWADGALDEITLAPPPGVDDDDFLLSPTVWGIDDSGVALVLQDAILDGDERRFVHRYERGGASTIVADLDRTSLGNAAIGSAGHVAVHRTETPGQDIAGLVLLGTDNSIVDVGRPQGALPIAHGVNASGQVAVTLELPGLVKHVARVDADGSITTLDEFDRAWAGGLNDEGTIVGAVAGEDPHAYSAFLWREGSVTAETLAGPAGALSVGAAAINNLDWVVGTAQLDESGPERAVLWLPGQGVIDLTEYFAAQLNGAVLTSASDISDTGLIVGEVVESDGAVSLFIAQVPAPSGAITLVASCLFSVRRRR